MQIHPNEIDIIEDAGMLNGHPVKMVRTKGGFWIACGKPKGRFREEALSAGSHPAIVKFNLEKQYPDFQPALMKSENFSDSIIVEKHSHFLNENLRKSGHDIYSVQNGSSVDFHITKHDVNVTSIKTTLEQDVMVMKNLLDLPKEFSRALAGATCEKAFSCKASKVKIEGK